MIMEEEGEKKAWKQIISYALFGYGKHVESGFGFIDYITGLLINVRMQRMVFPDWTIRVHLDQQTFDAFKDLFEGLPIECEICEPADITKAMLWRLKPCFDKDVEYTLCRDLDSPLTYREAQAVAVFVREQKAAHAITDSVSHNIAMMGGMIGFWKYFKDYTGARAWEELFANCALNFAVKGMDQTFLTNKIYPCFARQGQDSIVEHHILGMPNTFLSNRYTEIENVDLGLPEEYKETNDTCGHIGAAGYYVPVMRKLLNKHRELFKDLEEVERKYPQIAWWNENI